MSVSDNPLEPGSGVGAVLSKYLAPDGWRPWLVCILAVVLVVATFFLRLSFAESFGERPLLILFVLPIIFSAYLGGLWPGLLATLVAALLVVYFLIPPHHWFSIAKPADMVQWSFLIINGILISALNEYLHRSRRQILRLASFPHLNPNPVLEIDSSGAITYANPAALAIIKNCASQNSLADFLPQDMQEIDSAARQNQKRQFSRQVQIADSVFAETIAFAAPFNVCRLYTTDVTERRQTQEALKASEARLRLFIEYAPAALAMFDKDMRYLSVSRRWLSDFNLEDRDILGLCHYELFPDLPGRWKEAHRQGLAGEVVRSEADSFKRADGSMRWHQWEVRPWYDASGKVGGIVIFAIDITDRQQAEEALSHSLAEKTALLKEVHHRVKNNLQIVASLLSLQAKRTSSREVIEVLQDTGNRVHSMALLHEVLYRSVNLASINFAAYVDELCQNLWRSSGPVCARVNIVQQVPPISLPMELSLPCGLIINELVSNALKHAFPEERQGRIIVELKPTPLDRLTLSVRDDGLGPPPDVDIVNASTLGLRLVTRLAAQIQGHLTVTRPEKGGLAFTLVFPAPAVGLQED